MSLKDISRVLHKPQFLAVLVVTAIGAFLRFYNLTQREFWYDEAFSGLLVREKWSSMFELALRDVHPPFYYLLLKGWVTVFGYSDVTLRGFSALFGILLIPLVWYFSTVLVKSRKSWIPVVIAGFVAINPYLIEYSVEVRSYSLLVFLMVLAASCFYGAITKSPLKFNLNWLVFSVCISLAFLTHYITLFLVISFGAFASFVFVQSRILTKRTIKSLSLLIFQVALIPSIVFISWFSRFNAQLKNNPDSLGWITKPEFTDISKTLYTFLFGTNVGNLTLPLGLKLVDFISFESAAFILFFILIGTSGYAFGKFHNRDKSPILFLFVLWVLPTLLVLVASLFGRYIYTDRYLIGFSTFFLVFIVLVLSKINWKGLVCINLFYLLVVMCFIPVREPLGYKELVQFLKVESNINRIISTNIFDFLVFKYYLNQYTPGSEYEDKLKLCDFEHGWKYEGWIFIEGNVMDCPPKFEVNDLLVATEPPGGITYKELGRLGKFGVYDDLEILGSLP